MRGVKLYKEPGHYYSPVCDPSELRKFWRSEHRARQYARVDALLDYPAMLALWKDEIAPRALTFPWQQTEGFRYYGENTEFMYFDATILSGMLNWINPKRIIEIGSGYSSAVMFDTIDRRKTARLKSFTTIDIDLERVRRLNPPATAEMIEMPVQNVPMDLFQKLEAGDVFFIDSSHVLKTGSDVHYEYLHILPELASGVIVHIHDIFYPFEYPRRWLFKGNRSWNEIYLVDMLLTHSDRFEVMFFNDAMLQRQAEAMASPGDMFDRFAGFPEPTERHSVNGSIWLRRR